MGFRSNTKFKIIFVLIAVFANCTRAAAEILVNADEYIVVEAPLSTGEVSADEFKNQARHLAKLENARGKFSLLSSDLSEAVGRKKRKAKKYDAAKAQSFCDNLRRNKPNIRICEPNYLVQASVTPNDSYYSTLWGMQKISAPTAWNTTTGSTSVLVAVIDTGVDYTHPDLAANIWNNPGETANGLDDDGNGYVDDLHGINAITNSGNPYDDNEHGTHVAGTIGAVGNNGSGVSGVNWSVKIMGCKFLDSEGAGSTYDAITCINYASQKGAKVLNNSWGGGGYSQALADAIIVSQNAGALFVAAAGNEANDNDASPSYPANYQIANVLSVAATDENDNLAYFSNYGGSSVHVAAPGVDIVSTVPGGYASFNGTSMAAPHVSGLAALLLSEFPSETYGQIRNRIGGSVDQVAQLAGQTITSGRINAAAAFNADPNSDPFGAGGGGGGNNYSSIEAVYGYNPLRGRFIRGKTFQGKVFDVDVTGNPGESVILTLRIVGAQASMLDCNLGSFTIGNDGYVTVESKMSLVGSFKNLTSRYATFNANGFELSAKIGKIIRSSSRSARSGKVTSQDFASDAAATCAAIQSRIRSY